MRFFSRRNASLALSLAAVGVLAACGDDVTVPVAPAAPVTVSITPQAISLTPGSTAQLSVQITGGDPTPTLASCASGSAAVATAAVSGNGCRVTAVAAGSTTITATTSAGQAASAAVNVTALPAALTSFTISPSAAELAIGRSQQITPTVNGGAGVTTTYAYTSSSSAIASVSNSGLITGVAEGTATITVTATGSGAGFASTTLSASATIKVVRPAPANVTIQSITQGPIVTQYVDSDSEIGPLSHSYAGIITSTNTQVGQPIDITNVKDQIQLVLNLQPNGQQVDSVVAFIANPDGSSRRAAARQLFTNGAANAGVITLYINTADFSANFDAGTASIMFPNGQKAISASVFAGTTETQNAENNRQVVNFNNIDGYAIRYTNPARTAINPAVGLNWWGGPGAEGTGTATIVPVWFSGKTPTSITIGMRQGLEASTSICEETETFEAAPFRVSYSGDESQPDEDEDDYTVGNAVIECAGYEHPAVTAQNIAGVVASIDNQNNAGPRVTFANGYRFSTSISRPTANRLDYAGPETATPDITRALPAVTGWVNASFSIAGNTDDSDDYGVGVMPESRSWVFNGCTTTSTGTAAFDGTGATLSECATDATGGWTGSATRGPFRVRYTETDRLMNASTSAYSGRFGVDKTAPAIRWSTAALGGTATASDTTVRSSTTSSATHEVHFLDVRAGFIESTDVGAPEALLGTIPATAGSWQHFASRAAGELITVSATTKAVCVNPNALTTYLANTSSGSPTTSSTVAGATGAAFQTAPNCRFRTQPYTTSLGVLGDGYRRSAAVTLGTDKGIYHYATRVYDRAGNESEILRRRYAVDPDAPVVANLGVPATVTASSAPTLTFNAQDDVELRAVTIGTKVNGITEPLTYPQQLVDARFNDLINSPVASATTQLTLGAPTLLGVSNNLSTAPSSPIQKAYLVVWDVANRSNITSDSVTANYLSQGIPTLTNVSGSATGTNPYSGWVTLNSKAAGFNAPAGLKAQLTAGTNVTNQPFVRVELYRATAAVTPVTGSTMAAPLNGVHWELVGTVAGSTAALADNGGTRYWTYTLDDNAYVNRSNSASAHGAASVADQIIAIGVISNGSGFSTGATTIGGFAINFTITGLPTGASAGVSVGGPGGAYTVNGSGLLSVAAGGTYTFVAPLVTFGGKTYYASPANGAISVSSGVIATQTIVYAEQAPPPPPPTPTTFVLDVGGLAANGSNQGGISVRISTSSSAFAGDTAKSIFLQHNAPGNIPDEANRNSFVLNAGTWYLYYPTQNPNGSPNRVITCTGGTGPDGTTVTVGSVSYCRITITATNNTTQQVIKDYFTNP